MAARTAQCPPVACGWPREEVHIVRCDRDLTIRRRNAKWRKAQAPSGVFSEAKKFVSLCWCFLSALDLLREKALKMHEHAEYPKQGIKAALMAFSA